jgi:ferrochelatase
MAARRIRRAMAFFTSAYSSYSGCRQYRENIAARAAGKSARRAPADRQAAAFYNHPGFIEAHDRSRARGLEQMPGRARRPPPRFGLHGPQHSHWRWPTAALRGPACRNRCGSIGIGGESGAPAIGNSPIKAAAGRRRQPWLEPDIGDVAPAVGWRGKRGARRGGGPSAFSPITWKCFTIWITKAQSGNCAASSLGLNMVRAATVGTHPSSCA